MLKEILILNPVYITLFWALFFIIGGLSGKRSQLMLGIFMLVAFVLYSSHAAYFSGNIIAYSFLDGFYLFSNLSVYPIYYLYVRSITSKNDFRIVHLLHFLIPLVFAVVLHFLYSGLDYDQRIFYIRNLMEENTFREAPFKHMAFIAKYSRAVFGLQVVVYLFLTAKLIKEHEEELKNMFSNTEKYRLNWVHVLSVILVLMALTSLSLAIIGREKFISDESYLVFPSLIISVLIFTFGYIGSRQEVLAVIPADVENNLSDDILLFPKDSVLKRRFDEYIKMKKPFLDPDLKIWDISRNLGTNRTYISRIINEDYNMNFNRFINYHRVETAKKLIMEDKTSSLSYDTIAEMSGFGSINSFIRSFKEFENITPGKFRNSSRLEGK